ncbi:hypothetical protein DFH09DRAFT_1506325 [Mycena vulgaris]|nr:hypothetical protein DFH09DRAFT_1506325 [Mycena vulgaris]
MPRHNSDIPLVVERARYLPPRNPIDSEMGIVDATTLILLQKMVADAQEHGRVVWKENRERCARTGEVESDDLPCGPNSAQKGVAGWLVSAGLLDPDEDEESDDDSDDTSDSEMTPPESPSTPEPPRRRPWHRRLEISPRSPLSPIKLWSAVQRSTSSFLTLRLKPKHKTPPLAPPSPSGASPRRKKCLSLGSAPMAGPSKTPSADPSDSVLDTAFKRAVMLGTISDDDVGQIMRRHRDPLPQSRPSWFIPCIEPPPTLSKIPAPPPPKPCPQFDDFPSYRWPEPVPPPPPPPPTIEPARGEIPCPDLRWYHPFMALFIWHFLIVSFSAYVILRVVLKPLLCAVFLYYTLVFLLILFSLFPLI